MSERKQIHQEFLTGERALFASNDLDIYDTIFDDGESPLKESHGISLTGCFFRWKYPLWYCSDIAVKDCTWFDMARAGVWYTDNISVTDSIVYDSFITGEYLGWNAKNLTLINCTIESLQGLCYIDNLVMKNCKLINTTLAFEYSSVDAEI